MKISFSTLGCPDWAWEDMLSTAKDLGFNGIEIRGIGNELYAPKAKQFSSDNIDSAKSKLQKLELEIPCLTSGSYLFDKANIDAHMQEASDYIDLASKLKTPYVRVLGDAHPQPGEVDVAFVTESLKKLADKAKEKDVILLVETNGVFADSKLMKKVIEEIASNNVQVLWDIHHPYRFFNESVEQTFENLKNYIGFVHVKDSVLANGVIKYKMMGHGDMPIKNVISLLKDNGYTGYISLEWVKRWNLELEEPGIVFAHFAGYMKGLI